MKVSEDYIIREIAGEHLLIPVGAAALKIHGMINMTESGMLLWEHLQKGCGKQDLVDAILGEYDIDRETADADVEAFLNKLRKLDILEEQE